MAGADKFDVAVIGGGPAGIMSAIFAAKSGQRVILIERNNQLGRKLLLTGNGRCNITNAEFNLRNLVSKYNNGEFLFHCFSVFGPEEVIKFFENMGIKTKTELDGRVFPASNSGEEVLDALAKELDKNKVKVLFNCKVIDVEKKARKISKLILDNKPDYAEGYVVAKKYIFCSGGKSFPTTGSDGLAYNLISKLGHNIVKPTPALCPIKLKPDKSPTGHFDGPATISPKASLGVVLQGISLEKVKLTVTQKGLPAQAGKKCFSEQGDIVFTHFGISGPAILNISGRVGELLDKGDATIHVDLFPLLNHNEVVLELEDILKRYANRTVKNILCFLVPERLAEVLSDLALVNREKMAGNMSKVERMAIVKVLKNFEVTIDSLLGFEQAWVTRGGVSLKEIDHKTMKSKIIDNLFFAGEIIDVDGISGGFNLQACWSTGFLAGKSVVE